MLSTEWIDTSLLSARFSSAETRVSSEFSMFSARVSSLSIRVLSEFSTDEILESIDAPARPWADVAFDSSVEREIEILLDKLVFKLVIVDVNPASLDTKALMTSVKESIAAASVF